MKAAAKWFVVGGALLLILGFVLPVVSVSNSGTQVSMSLLQIAGVSYWFFLYLVPVFALLVVLLALVPANDPTPRKLFLAGQAVALGGILLVLLGTLAYIVIQPRLLQDPSSLGSLLPANLQSETSSVWPGIGIFLLLLGTGFIVFGIFSGFLPDRASDDLETKTEQADPSIVPSQLDEPKPAVREAYLDGKKGSFAGKKIHLKVENFSIGRGRENDLQLPDKKISRLHARVRYSQGSWFVQDQDSKLGTQINGKPVKAARLTSGDSIKIGDDVFIFHFHQDPDAKS